MKKLVKQIYFDSEKGIVFVTKDNKRYAYKYYHDASMAICQINLEHLPERGKRKEK